MAELVNHGLNNQARDLVESVAVARESVVRTYPCGKVSNFDREVEVPVFAVEPLERVAAAGYIVQLSCYKSADGRYFEEFVQSATAGCGAHVFLALKERDGTPVAASLREPWELSVGSACTCRRAC